MCLYRYWYSTLKWKITLPLSFTVISGKHTLSPGLFYDKNRQLHIILTKEKPGKPTLLRTVTHYTQF